MVFIYYPKCSTCRKAKQYLDRNHISYQERNIVLGHPSKEELTLWYKKSGYPLKKFFNTSGLLYKELKLKDKLDTLTEEEQLELLSSNGMLVKRPLLIDDHFIFIGFKEKEWEVLLEQNRN